MNASEANSGYLAIAYPYEPVSGGAVDLRIGLRDAAGTSHCTPISLGMPTGSVYQSTQANIPAITYDPGIDTGYVFVVGNTGTGHAAEVFRQRHSNGGTCNAASWHGWTNIGIPAACTGTVSAPSAAVANEQHYVFITCEKTDTTYSVFYQYGGFTSGAEHWGAWTESPLNANNSELPRSMPGSTAFTVSANNIYLVASEAAVAGNSFYDIVGTTSAPTLTATPSAPTWGTPQFNGFNLDASNSQESTSCALGVRSSTLYVVCEDAYNTRYVQQSTTSGTLASWTSWAAITTPLGQNGAPSLFTDPSNSANLRLFLGLETHPSLGQNSESVYLGSNTSGTWGSIGSSALFTVY